MLETITTARDNEGRVMVVFSNPQSARCALSNAAERWATEATRHRRAGDTELADMWRHMSEQALAARDKV